MTVMTVKMCMIENRKSPDKNRVYTNTKREINVQLSNNNIYHT